MMSLLAYFRAIYEFNTNLIGELPLSVGDVVFAEEAANKDWLYGTNISRLDNSSGLFPASFVTKINIRNLKHGEKLYIAVENFKAQQKGDLEFYKGDLIIGVNQIDSNWVSGENGLKRGIFPKNFVREISIPDENKEANGSTNDSSGSKDIKAKAVTKLEAKLPEELSLNFGEIVYIEKFVDKIWCEGRTMDGRRGIFPKGFVEILAENGTSTDLVTSSVAKNALPRPLPDYTSVVTSTKMSDPVITHVKQMKLSPVPAESRGSGHLAIEPYARTKYAFRAEYPEELSLPANCIVKLIKHVDDEWTLGEFNGKKGIFPTSYADVIVDCPRLDPHQQQKRASLNEGGSFSHFSGYLKRQYLVLYDFLGTVQGDLPAKIGDRLTLIRNIDNSWIEAFNNNNNRRGIIPLDFVRECDDLDFLGRTQDLNKKFNTSNSIITKECTKTLDDSIARNLDLLTGRSRTPSLNISENPESVRSSSNKHDGQAYISASSLEIKKPVKPSSPPPRPAALPSLKQGNIHEDLAEQRRQKQEQKKLEVRALRTRIFNEVLQSERDYNKDLTISCQIFSSYGDSLDVHTLLSGFEPIIKLSDHFQNKLQEEFNKDFVYQEIGSAFLSLENEFKEVYGGFCQTHEDAQLLLNKYDADLTRQNLLQEILRKIQSRTICMDLSSMLSRPVQRVLKYPLFISELLKCTEDNQSDKVKLMMALKVMTEVAQCINETKRRKDLVLKYRKDGDVNLSERLSRFNMHTFRKKSSRLSMRLSTTIGFAQSIKDEEFETCEKQFRVTEKLCRSFVRDVQLYCEQMLMRFNHEATLAEDFFIEIGDQNLLAKNNFDSLSALLSNEVQHFFDIVNDRVRQPVSTILQACKGPEKLIAKRNDKLLDYESAIAKCRKEKGKSIDSSVAPKSKQFDEELRNSKVDYEALNTQLKTELPKFCSIAQDVILTGAKAFIAAQRSFVYDLAKRYQILQTVDLNLEAGGLVTMEQIVERFMQKNRNVTNNLAKFSFSVPPTTGDHSLPTLSRSPSFARKRNISSTSSNSSLPRNEATKIVFPQKPQADVDREQLQTKYGEDKLFVVSESYQPVNEIDINVKKGDLVAVIVNKDPMGDRSRWFVDNGSNKGFVPSHFLEKYQGQQKQEPPILLDLSSPLSASNNGNEVFYSQIRKPLKDTRPLVKEALVMAGNSQKQPIIGELNQKLGLNKSGGVPEIPKASHTLNDRKLSPASVALLQPVRKAPPPPAAVQKDASFAKKSTTLTRSDSYSSAIRGKSEAGHVTQPTVLVAERSAVDQDESVEFFTAIFDFNASSDSELPLTVGQLVAVHAKHDQEFNHDWWLAENEAGDIGYVPANYLEAFRA